MRTPSDEEGPLSGRLRQRDDLDTDEPVSYRILASAPVALGIPHSSAYAAVARGAIICIRYGRHIAVPRAAVEGLLEETCRAPDKGWPATLDAARWRGRKRLCQVGQRRFVAHRQSPARPPSRRN